MMKAKRLVQQGVWTILTCVVDVRGKEITLDNIPIVNEFLNVFSEDLPRIPCPQSPYNMASIGLKELMM